VTVASGVVVAVDPGDVRTGVACTDAGQVLASPVSTLAAAETVTGVVHEVVTREAVGVLVGFPLSMTGEEGTAARKARSYARRLATALATAGLTTPVFLVDERLTTVSATTALRAAGRDSRSARRVVDQVAATTLLQGVVDAARARGVDVVTLLTDAMGERVRPSGSTD
jgi:putative Holliday junction resolvase